MMFNVPQFIDVEDKIAGPLTWRQLLWMIGMGAVVLVIFGIFETTFAIVLSVPVVLLFAALAFYKPNGIPLIVFIFHGILFFFRPKVSVWERPTGRQMTEKKPEVTHAPALQPNKTLTSDKIKELAGLIDSNR